MRDQKENKTKYQELLHREISTCLKTDFADPSIMLLTITHVELNNDYSFCKVFWDVYDPTKVESITEHLAKIIKPLKSRLARDLPLRKIPAIKFRYNGQFEAEHAIMNLIRSTATTPENDD